MITICNIVIQKYKNMATRLIKTKRSNNLVGNDKQELIDTAMKLVTRSQEFYRREITKDLESKQTSVISIHSCAFRNAGVTIFFDPENKLTDEDLKKPFRDIKAKYPEFYL